MSNLLQLQLSDMRHKKNCLWFDPEDGMMYYGPDPDNLVFPEGFELQGRFPPVCLADVREAFLLGRRSRDI